MCCFELLFGGLLCLCNLNGFFQCQGSAFIDEPLPDSGAGHPKHNSVSDHLVTVVVSAILDKQLKVRYEVFKWFTVALDPGMKFVPGKDFV